MVPSGYLTVLHGKSPFLIGKPSISMFMLTTIPSGYTIYRWFTELKNCWIFHGKLLVITR